MRGRECIGINIIHQLVHAVRVIFQQLLVADKAWE